VSNSTTSDFSGIGRVIACGTVAILSALALTACGGGSDGGTSAAAQAASSAASGSSDPAPASSDLHIDGKVTGFKWSSGLTSITASTDIATTGVFGTQCETAADTGLQLDDGTSVAIGAHIASAGGFVADRITCSPGAAFAFDAADTGLRIVGIVTNFVGTFRNITPDSVTVQTAPIDTTHAQITGCDVDASFNLPASVKVDARAAGTGYAAYRVECY